MNSFFAKCATAAAVLSLVAVVFAADDALKGKKKGNDPTAGVSKKLEGLDLTAEQKAKIEAIIAEHRPILAAAQAKVNKSISRDQQKARQKAMQEARAAGTKGKAVNEAGLAAMNLNDEEKKAYGAALTEQQAKQAAFTKAIADVLTEEQRAQAKIGGKKKGKKNAA